MNRIILVCLAMAAVTVSLTSSPQSALALPTTYQWTNNGSNGASTSASGSWTLEDTLRVVGPNDYTAEITDWTFEWTWFSETHQISSNSIGGLNRVNLTFDAMFNLTSFDICVSTDGTCTFLSPTLTFREDGWSSRGILKGASFDIPAPQTVTTTATVPEPTSMLLLGTGFLSLAGYRWHQRRRERAQVA